MATRLERSSVSLHDDDVYAWSKEQAVLLRDRRFGDLDLEHLIEEIEDVGAHLKRAVRSRIRRIVEHFLKLEHSPAKSPRAGWYDSIIAQRSDLLDELTPSIRREIETEFDRLYERARSDAALSLRKHGEDAVAEALPERCPYTFDQIIGDWLP